MKITNSGNDKNDNNNIVGIIGISGKEYTKPERPSYMGAYLKKRNLSFRAGRHICSQSNTIQKYSESDQYAYHPPKVLVQVSNLRVLRIATSRLELYLLVCRLLAVVAEALWTEILVSPINNIAITTILVRGGSLFFVLSELFIN
jgi:hypothetical protein